MFLWTRRNEFSEHQFLSNIAHSVFAEIFSRFILEPFLTYGRQKYCSTAARGQDKTADYENETKQPILNETKPPITKMRQNRRLRK